MHLIFWFWCKPSAGACLSCDTAWSSPTFVRLCREIRLEKNPCVHFAQQDTQMVKKRKTTYLKPPDYPTKIHCLTCPVILRGTRVSAPSPSITQTGNWVSRFSWDALWRGMQINTSATAGIVKLSRPGFNGDLFTHVWTYLKQCSVRCSVRLDINGLSAQIIQSAQILLWKFDWEMKISLHHDMVRKGKGCCLWSVPTHKFWGGCWAGQCPVPHLELTLPDRAGLLVFTLFRFSKVCYTARQFVDRTQVPSAKFSKTVAFDVSDYIIWQKVPPIDRPTTIVPKLLERLWDTRHLRAFERSSAFEQKSSVKISMTYRNQGKLALSCTEWMTETLDAFLGLHKVPPQWVPASCHWWISRCITSPASWDPCIYIFIATTKMLRENRDIHACAVCCHTSTKIATLH